MIRTKLCKCTWQGYTWNVQIWGLNKLRNVFVLFLSLTTTACRFTFILIFSTNIISYHIIDHFIKTRSAVLVFHDWVKIWIHLIRRVERKIRSNIFHLEEPLFLERLFKNLLNRFTNTTHHFNTCHKWYLIVSVRTDFTF